MKKKLISLVLVVLFILPTGVFAQAPNGDAYQQISDKYGGVYFSYGGFFLKIFSSEADDEQKVYIDLREELGWAVGFFTGELVLDSANTGRIQSDIYFIGDFEFAEYELKEATIEFSDEEIIVEYTYFDSYDWITIDVIFNLSEQHLYEHFILYDDNFVELEEDIYFEEILFEDSTFPIIKSSFSDVSNEFWGAESIEWAYEKGLINGYGDGRFGPNDLLTEGQFVKLVALFFTGSSNPQTVAGEHWADPYYEVLAQYNLPFKLNKDTAISRGVVAQVIAATQNQESELATAIHWMYDVGLTTGKYSTGDKVYDYDPDGQLTRAEAAAFFNRLFEQEIISLKN